MNKVDFQKDFVPGPPARLPNIVRVDQGRTNNPHGKHVYHIWKIDNGVSLTLILQTIICHSPLMLQSLFWKIGVILIVLLQAHYIIVITIGLSKSTVRWHSVDPSSLLKCLFCNHIARLELIRYVECNNGIIFTLSTLSHFENFDKRMYILSAVHHITICHAVATHCVITSCHAKLSHNWSYIS